MFNCGLDEGEDEGESTTRRGKRRSLLRGEKRRGRRCEPGDGTDRGGGNGREEDTDSRQRRSDAVVVAPDAATMRPHCWVMVALAGIMSYFSPERALGAPQREGERSRRRGGGGGGGLETCQ